MNLLWGGGYRSVHNGHKPLHQWTEMGAFYWTVPAPDIGNSRREEYGSISV
jgi:hypothetical protein